MLIISHRGNREGADSLRENHPGYVTDMLYEGFNVEVDAWHLPDGIYLGHDKPRHKVDYNFLVNRNLWIHCKNIEAIVYLSSDDRLNVFYHTEGVVLSSKRFLITAPGLLVKNNSIACMPELFPNWDISHAYGIITDYPLRYRDEKYN